MTATVLSVAWQAVQWL